jgi:hypothetical protein
VWFAKKNHSVMLYKHHINNKAKAYLLLGILSCLTLLENNQERLAIDELP